MYLDIMNNARSWDINIEDWNNLVQEEDDTRKGYINIPGVKSGVIHYGGKTCQNIMMNFIMRQEKKLMIL